jgi:O-6-methylguanine DNA methyltransferase
MTDKAIQWAVTRVDGLIASVSPGLGGAERTLSQLRRRPFDQIGEISVRKMDTDALLALAGTLREEDLLLMGSEFQIMVWKALLGLRRGEETRLWSYSEFAESIGRGSAVRNVAHAIAQNPLPVIIPCHLVIPKESLERLRELEDENGLFRRKALHVIDRHIDYGEYAYGPQLKRSLILRQLGVD